MKRKIYFNMMLVSLIGILLVSALMTGLLINDIRGQKQSELSTRCALLQKAIENSNDKLESIEALEVSPKLFRISVVSELGEVLYDNAADAAALENHLNRKEVAEAMEFGVGTSERFSETLGEKMYYYSVRLSDDTVLRVSESENLIPIFLKVLTPALLIILLALVINIFISASLTRRILKPLSEECLINGTVPYDELAPFMGMITRQKKQISEQVTEINRSAATFNSVTENMTEGLILLDPADTVLSANKSALAPFGAEAAEGRNILEITRNVEIMEHITLAKESRNSDIAIALDGKIYNVFFSGVNGGVMLLILDITEKAKAEQRRREFSANVSHELKTPLTSISGYAELLENGMVKPEDTESFAGRIKSEAQRLITLIDDIIKLSELDESSDADFGKLDIAALANEVAASLFDKAAERSITVTVDSDNAPKIICGNRKMLFEMLYNLTENAIKYNEDGGRVDISLAGRGDESEISVSDTGIGIDKKYHDRIFERFYRVDKSHSKKIDGTGLGLSIVKHVVNYHMGTLSVESAAGKGTKISIVLPKKNDTDN